jgi:hypothetical protein
MMGEWVRGSEPAAAAELRQRDPEGHDKIRTGPRFLFFRLVKRGLTASSA